VGRPAPAAANRLLNRWLTTSHLVRDTAELRRFYDHDYRETESVVFSENSGHKHRLLAGITDSEDFSGARVLEIGCGCGVLLDMMGRQWATPFLCGIDLSGKMLAEGASLFPSQLHVHGSGSQLPFQSGAFEVVFFADYLEHVVDPALALAETRRVARRLVCMVPLESGVISDLHYSWRTWRGKPTHRDLLGHLQRFRAPALDSLLQQAGFTIVRRALHQEAVDRASTLQGRLYQLPHRLLRPLPALNRLMFGEFAYVASCR